jgi:hypothetical protein
MDAAERVRHVALTRDGAAECRVDRD